MKHSSLALAIVFAASAHVCTGGQAITLATESATAKIDLDGAKVVSLRIGGEETIWMPKVPGKPGSGSWNHGGIPVCWPWFGSSGGHDENSMHGFAKDFRFEEVSVANGKSRSMAVLRLKSSDATRRVWPHDFELTFEATLTDSLRLSLRTVNTGATAFSYTAGFHPYFLVGDRTKARVTGLDGMRFCDSRVKTTLDEVWRGDLPLDRSYDHVFDEKRPYACHCVVDQALGRTIRGTSSGVSRLVIWAPDASEGIGDAPGSLAPGDWKHLACVEPAFLWDGHEVVLPPGGRHQFDFEISVSK